MLTYWVLETVSKELGDWFLDHSDVSIDVNVPPEILGRGGLEYAAIKTGVSGLRNQITLEVTERGIPDNVGMTGLEAASKSGVRIALDDVTLSSTHLVILSRCTLDLIKLDKSLTDNRVRSRLAPVAQRLVGLAAINARRSHRRIETEIQARALQAAGVSMAQGYYFSQPISAEKLKAYYSGTGA